MQDDSYAGDTNGDGYRTTPQKGDWAGIQFAANSNGSILDYVKVDYSQTAISGQNASFKLTNSILKRASGSAVSMTVDENKATSEGSFIQNNSILECGSMAIYATVTNNQSARATPTPRPSPET